MKPQGDDPDGSDELAWLAASLPATWGSFTDDGDVVALTSALHPTRWAGGTYVFRQGQRAQALYIVRSGMAEVSTGRGRRRVVIELVRPGSVFGDLALLLGTKQPLDGRLVRDSTLLQLDAAEFARLLRNRPGLATRWLRHVAHRLDAMQDRVVDLLAGTLEARLVALLVKEQEGGLVSLSQEKLGELLGAPRTSVNRVLRTLEASGHIELSYRKVRVVSLGAIAGLVDDPERQTA